MRRFCQRNDFTEEEALNRIRSQMSLSAKIQKSDIVIDNSGTAE